MKTQLLHVVKNIMNTRTRYHFRSVSTYEGDGKTVAKVLNKDLDFLMVNKISTIGFRLNNGVQVLGPAIIFPRSVMCWNVNSIDEVNDDSLSIFTVLVPRFSFLILGYGSSGDLPDSLKKDLISFGSRNKMTIELLPTESAVSTFNFLNFEKRLIVGAFIPPRFIKIYDDSAIVTESKRNKALELDLI